VTGERARVDADVLHWLGLRTDGLRDAISGTAPSLHEGAIPLEPYAAAWLHDGGVQP
jgi:amylosucrase